MRRRILGGRDFKSEYIFISVLKKIIFLVDYSGDATHNISFGE
jgi:hypothetical protein